jgi:hypothetical protein
MTQDTTYPDADLIVGYLARKGVKTYHTEALVAEADPDLTELGGGWFELGDGTKVQGEAQAHNAAVRASIKGTGVTNCGEHALADLTDAGWARSLERRGLEEHPGCRKARTEAIKSLEDALYTGVEVSGPTTEGDPE